MLFKESKYRKIIDKNYFFIVENAFDPNKEFRRILVRKNGIPKSFY